MLEVVAVESSSQASESYLAILANDDVEILVSVDWYTNLACSKRGRREGREVSVCPSEEVKQGGRVLLQEQEEKVVQTDRASSSG